jgi:hypothetical protein
VTVIKLIPITMQKANEFVLLYHRHHGKVRGCKFCVAVTDEDGQLHGVAIVGRPVSRYLDNGLTAEVTRLCTDGYRNACSFLYAACVRIARCMGFEKIITYILITENGASLRASGWCLTRPCGGGNWNVPSRPRKTQDTGRKLMYFKELR